MYIILILLSVLVSPNVHTLRVRTVAVAESADPQVSKTPTRPYLKLKNGVVDGSERDNTLEISFDEMSHDYHQYTYTVTLLNADATPSDLLTGEYLKGFTRCDITDYSYSLNTRIDYTHYTFQIPNSDMTLTHSGRYQVTVYEDGDEHNVVLKTEFDVVDPQVSIVATMTPNTAIELSGRYQQVDITVTDPQSLSRDMTNEYFIVVQQNGREDNKVYRPKPNLVSTNTLKWFNNKELIFEGGNEYRHFDTYSTYFAGYNVDRIAYESGEYHALLEIERPRQGSYMHEYDNDGQFVVNAERIFDDLDSEAEYMWAHWLLTVDKPFMRPVYVIGDLFENRLDARNRMLYNPDEKSYYLTALVKQGGYNYLYALPETGGKLTLQGTEGSHWQTENEYRIYVYRRLFGSRADELVGLYIII